MKLIKLIESISQSLKELIHLKKKEIEYLENPKKLKEMNDYYNGIPRYSFNKKTHSNE